MCKCIILHFALVKTETSSEIVSLSFLIIFVGCSLFDIADGKQCVRKLFEYCICIHFLKGHEKIHMKMTLDFVTGFSKKKIFEKKIFTKKIFFFNFF